jgi:hypothetical protein
VLKEMLERLAEHSDPLGTEQHCRWSHLLL